MTQTPAGWHPDPGAPGSGRERFWDGSAWTEQVRDGDATSALPDNRAGLDPTVAVPSTGQGGQRGGYQAGQQGGAPNQPVDDDDDLHAPTRIVAPEARGPGAQAAANAYPAWGGPGQGPTNPPAGPPAQGSWPGAPGGPSTPPSATPPDGPASPSFLPPSGAPAAGAGGYPGQQQPGPSGYPGAQPTGGGYPPQGSAYPGQQPPPSGYPGGATGATGSPMPPGPGSTQTHGGGGGYPPPGGTAYGTGGQPPKKSKKGLWILLGSLAALLVIALIATLLFLRSGGGGETASSTTTTATAQATTTSTSSTSTSTSTTSTSTTSTTTAPTTVPKQPTQFADPGGKFKFTHPGWEQQPPSDGYTVFKVPPNQTDNLFGGQFEVKSSPGLVLNETACAQQPGTVEVVNVGGTPTKFCKALSKNKLVTVWAGFPPVGGSSVAVAYSALLQTDPAQAKMPADVAAALASMKP